MKRGEKGVEEGSSEKQENLGEKLKKAEKRGGNTTPVIPFWRLQQKHHLIAEQDSVFKEEVDPFHIPGVSARKLASVLWELHHYKLPLAKMNHGVNIPPSRLRRLQPYHHHHQQPDPSPSSPDMPESAGSLKRHVATSLMQRHRSTGRTSYAMQPVSPASYDSSMEVAPYNPAVIPTSSKNFKESIGETNYSLKTSTDLLKVLNRIWSLEEQHASNVSLMKSLKKELDHARIRIKELVRDKQAERHLVNEVMEQIAGEKMVRKSKEQDRINAALLSVRDELDAERKLRNRSESLHRKLARELHEVKTSLANAVKERDKVKNSQQLLEVLCDEFACGIRDYEQELHSLRQKSDKDWTERNDNDRLILHISESWLDERMQKSLEPQYDQVDKSSTVEKLRSDIETFLQSKQTGSRSNGNLGDPTYRRSSRESIPLSAAVSAPQDVGDECDSVGSDSHCFELQKPSSAGLENSTEETVKPIDIFKKPTSQERRKGRNPSNLQVKFEEQMAKASLPSESRNQPHERDLRKTSEKKPIELSTSKKSEICEVTEESTTGKMNKADATSGVESNYMIHDHELVASLGNFDWRTQASPVRQWTDTLPSNKNDISELPPDLKENTLKSKLLEARTRGQRSRSRLKGSKISF